MIADFFSASRRVAPRAHSKNRQASDPPPRRLWSVAPRRAAERSGAPMSAAIGKAAMATPPMVTQHRSVSLGSATSTGSRASPSLLAEPPLRRVSSFLEEPSSPSVTVRLQEPFWSSMAHVRLLVRAVQLQTLLESETGGPQQQAPHRLDELCASHPNIAQLLDEFYQEVATLQARPTRCR